MSTQFSIAPSMDPPGVGGHQAGLSTVRAIIPIAEFYLDESAREPWTEERRAEHREFRHGLRHLFAAERRARRHVAIRASIEQLTRARGRTSHRVGASKPSANSGDSDDGDSSEPPGDLVSVATIDPRGRRRIVKLDVDPARTDAATMIFLARQAVGHDLATCSRGLDDLRVEVVRPYGVGGVA